MDLQTRKIVFIQEFLKLDSDKVISALEKVLKKETEDNVEMKPMGSQEFQIRIDTANEDSENGRLTNSLDLDSEIEKWK